MKLCRGIVSSVALVLGAAVALAQTVPAPSNISPQQIQAPAASSARVFVALPSGALSLVQLGAGISIDMATVPPTLTVSAVAPPSASVTHDLLALASDRTLRTAKRIIILYRNGVAQMEGESANFTRTSTGVQLTAQTQPEARDQWSCLCQ